MRLLRRHVYARCDERGYRYAEVEACFVRPLDGEWWEVDVEHPAYPRVRPGSRPPLTAAKVASFALAMLSGTYVSIEVQAEREELCRQCPYMAQDDKGPYCNQCGCNVSSEGRRITNLTAYEENLPAWGCKHPQRAQGKGWAR